MDNLSPINSNLDVPTKKYVDDADAASVAKAGDSMTGNLDMGTAAKVVNHPLPDDPGDVASKEYVDSQGGGSHSSLTNLENDDHGQYAPIHVIDAADPDPEEYQRPGQIVVRKGVVVNEGLEFLQKQGGAMTGPLFLQSDPASDMEAVTKQYVDGLSAEVAVVTAAANHTLVTNRLVKVGAFVFANLSFTPSTAPTSAVSIGTVPVGFRPAYDTWVVIGSTTGTAYLGSFYADGKFAWRGATFPGAGVSGYLSAVWAVV